MLSVPGSMDSSGVGAAETHGSGGVGSEVGGPSSVPGFGLEERGGGGNRWPREETLALIRIRSEMDVAFRESSLKAPLWEQVSRKMAYLGFQRTPKKCKEKFENVYKYHKRTKQGRVPKSDGKTYRFFDPLEALENSSTAPPPSSSAAGTSNLSSHFTGSAISPTPLSVVHPNTNPQFQPELMLPPQINFDTTSSSTSSDKDTRRQRRRRRRKWKQYFRRLMKEVVERQEALQKKFLETLENRERDRTAWEEARRAEQTTRINREHEILVRERSMAVSKDAALISFLQKVTNQNNLQLPITTTPPPPPPHVAEKSNFQADNSNIGPGSGSSSRWPKAEVLALINLRKGLELKYQENGGKGPLWEEMSAAMAELGYSRSAKRCKEKWENINKYFKKVKESNKERPRDAKTCPYFHQLEALYKERANSGRSNSDIKDVDNNDEELEEEEDNEEEDGEEDELIANKQASMED